MEKLKFLILMSVFLISACTSVPYTRESIDELANCIKSEDIKEYGTFWCPNCAKQKKMFGSSYDILEKDVYVECDPRGDDEQSVLCIEKEIQKYPTWEFQDGSRIVGTTELNILDEKSGCNVLVAK